MAKVTDHDRHMYYEKVKVYVAKTRALLDEEKRLLVEAKKNNSNSPLLKLTLADEMLNLSSFYIAINGISQSVLKNKNEEALNDARKSLYKAVIYLEEVVSNSVDAPFSDYEDKLAAIESFDPNQRYKLICKMGLAIDLMELAYGDNSKWRWTFVDIEGRFAAAAKNIVDLKNVYANMDLESEFYESTVYHLRLIKRILVQAADRYREKYELSTSQTLDFKTGINFLSALRRLHIVLAENEESQEIKKKLSIWTQKLETDLRKQEEAKKRK
ncbi:MAG: hypothetical protein LBG94_04145 [Treponema sp.]|jgi:hypothetical protein|nr:hypothetical protein [Treponema sp.]